MCSSSGARKPTKMIHLSICRMLGGSVAILAQVRNPLWLRVVSTRVLACYGPSPWRRSSPCASGTASRRSTAPRLRSSGFAWAAMAIHIEFFTGSRCLTRLHPLRRLLQQSGRLQRTPPSGFDVCLVSATDERLHRKPECLHPHRQPEYLHQMSRQ